MEENITGEVGIKYKVNRINEKEYILTPVGVVVGYSVGNTFYSNEIYLISQSKEEIEQSEYVVDQIYDIDELKFIYEFEDEDNLFVKDYFFCEEQEYFQYVQIEGDKIIKRHIKTDVFKSEKAKETYAMLQQESTIMLNEDALSELLSIETIEELKRKLERFKKNLKHLADVKASDGVSRITLENGQITKIETGSKIVLSKDIHTQENSEPVIRNSDISVRGLEQYIKERVLGHDDQIRQLATRIIMNQTSTPKFGVEPILIVGPTGTGKTQTIKAASEYLGLPFVEVNTPNLVPQGIRGASLESYLSGLKSICNGDLKRAERAFIYLDEFDKLGSTDAELKGQVKTILLKFIEGGDFLVDEKLSSFIFNTKMLNKIFTGAFQDLFETPKVVGFGTSGQLKATEFSPKNIYEKTTYEKELVTRIPHIIPYFPLTREEQRRVILEGKESIYTQKRARYKEQFLIDFILEDGFIDGILTRLAENDQSMRDLNNLFLSYLAEPEYQLLDNPRGYKRLVLTRDTIDNPNKFKLD